MLLIIKFLLSVILTETITELVVKSEIFNPLRAKIFHLGEHSSFFNWLHRLIDCGYCFSVWAGIFVSILFLREIKVLHWSIDWLILALILHRLSNLFHNVMDRIHGIDKI